MSTEDTATKKPPKIGAALTEKRGSPETVMKYVSEGDDLIVGMYNCEPATVLDAIEAQAEQLSGVRIHQMLPVRERRYMHGLYPGLRHVSWFLSPPDRHGYFSLGTHADYAAALIGEVPFFVEVNHQMPRTFGENQVHLNQVVGWCEADYPLAELPARPSRQTDRRIAQYVAERIPDGATLQAGIGAIPNEVLRLLADHKDLGVNTELLSDGFVDLIEKGV